MDFSKKAPATIFCVVTAICLISITIPTEVVAQSSGDITFEPCTDGEDAAGLFNVILQICRVIGPTIGVIGYAGYTVASSAKGGESNYNSKARKSVIKGFSVPVIIELLEAMTNLFVNQNVDCFFP